MSWTITPRFTQWTPANITTALWLDAADASTVTAPGGVVEQWNDKSGNGRNVTQSTAANRPTYATNKIVFDGTDLLNVPTAIGTASQNGFIFACVASSASSDAGLIGQDNADVSYWNIRGQNQLRSESGTAAPFANTFGIASNAVSLVTWIQANNFIQSRANGAPVTTLTPSATSFQYLTTSVKIGRKSSESTSGNFGSKDIYELICIGSLSSLTTIEKLEGYLAHKWGLTANLPANHPYKVNPPAP
jgi:hypothetical protein